MLCQAEDLEVLGDGCLDDLFKGVFGVARAELARVAVVGEWHCIFIWASFLAGVSQLMLQDCVECNFDGDACAYPA